ncbi:MAG: hypothetical protein E7206_05695 [Clostridium beijerinckii]|nr:hypothetical protein [Clostridium beijerinckii]
MNITKKIKTIGFTSLAALTLVASTSMVSFASTESNKPAKTSESATTVKPDHMLISKSGDGINIETTTTYKIDNTNLSKAAPDKASGTDTPDMPNQIFISKSGDGISIQTTTTDNLNNVDLNKVEPTKADSSK